MKHTDPDVIFEKFRDHAGELVIGTVCRIQQNDLIISLQDFEVCLPKRERVQGENHKIGDSIRAYLLAIETRDHEQQIVLSRSHPNFVRRLLEAEVPEIANHAVEIRAIAREAGFRTKVAVSCSDEKVNPIRACIGADGEHIKNITKELNKEKLDFVKWSDNPEVFARRALGVSRFLSVGVDTENKTICVTVDSVVMAKAIGRKGQNVRLASRIVGLTINVSGDDSAESKETEVFNQSTSPNPPSPP